MRLIAQTLTLALLLSGLAAPAMAQTDRPAFRPGASVTDSNPQPVQSRCWDPNGSVWTVCGREAFKLATANAASAAVTVYGGDYILTQTCTGYGTVTFQVLGPDAATWLPLASYTSTDTGSGHGFALGAYARVRVTITGTTGCNALLARVPA